MESNSGCNDTCDYQNRTIDREAGVRFVITSMITDWTGRHHVLLSINQDYDKIRETNKASIERWTIQNVVMNAEKPSSLVNKVHRNSARKMVCTFQLQARRVQLSN